jgi:hypothetical protein
MSDRTTTSRRRVLIGLGTGTAAALAGCSGGDGDNGGSTPTDARTDTPTETPPGTATVRVAHLSPDAPDVDVSVDGSVVLEGLAYGTVSDYLEVPAGDRQVGITAAGDSGTSLSSGTVTVAAGADYTVAAVGQVDDPGDRSFEPLVLRDAAAPGEDTARVRLVHASTDAPAVDVTLASNGDTLYDGVAYGEASAVEVPAGEYTLQVRGESGGDGGEPAAEFDVTLDGGTAYTAFAAGYFDPEFETDAPFDLIVAHGAADAGGGGSDDGGEPARVRVAHASPNAPDVDVSVDGSVVVEEATFGAVSDYLDLAAGSHTVALTVSAAPDVTVFEGEVSVAAGADYTLVAAGETGDMTGKPFEVLVLEDDNSDPGDDARVRFVHASPDVDVTVGGTGDALFDGVAFGRAAYTEVPADEYAVQVRRDAEGDDGEVVGEYDVALETGQVYTAFVAGYLSPTDERSEAQFTLVVEQDTGTMSG